MTVLTRRAALVIGGAIGIGALVTRELARQGWAVAIHYDSELAQADAESTAIQRLGGTATVIHADLTKESETAPLIPLAAERLGSLSLLAYMAVHVEDDTAQTADRAGWDRMMETNLRAPLLLSQQLFAQLPTGQPGGIILHVDQRAQSQSAHYLTYGLSQRAAATLTRSLAVGLAPRVRVNAIGPAPALPLNPLTADPTPAADPDAEICRTLRFILETPCLTGQILALDGAEALGWPPLEPAAATGWAAVVE